MAHPALKMFGQAIENHVGLHDVHDRFPELTPIPSGNHLATKILSNQLKSIADAQNGQTRPKKIPGEGKGCLARHTESGLPERITPSGLELPNFFQSGEIRHDFAVHGQFTNSAADQLSVLRTKIKNQNIFAVNGLAPGENWL